MTDPNRQHFLKDVREGVAAALHEPLGKAGFTFTRRDAAFRRERDGVVLAVRLGISSRPPSLGAVGILLEPTMTAVVPEWMAEAERRLAGASGLLAKWKVAAVPAIWELLDWQVPGRRPHWTLPDEPTASDIAAVGASLRASVTDVGLPFLERVSSKDRILDTVESGEVRVAQDARFGIACGAILAGRADVAKAVIAPYGTANREAVADVLDLASST